MAKKAQALALFIVFLLILSVPCSAQKPPRRPSDRVTMNFVDVELASLVRVMSSITGKNFIYDETLKGKVTIIAPARLSTEEALNLFVSALDVKNFTLVPVNGSYKIVPSAQARQSGVRVLEESETARSDEYIVRLIPLDYISAQEAFPVVQPLVSRNGQVSVFGSRNALLIIDTYQNIEKILKVLEPMDTAPSEGGEPELVYLKYAQADTVAQILRREEQRRSGRRGAEPGTANGESLIISDPRLNAVILSNALKEREFYRRFIELLDVPPPEASSRINVYYLENADAEDLSRVLDNLLRGTGGAPAPAGAAPAAAAGVPAALTQELTGKISITPDKATNSLIIMASPADYQNLMPVIQRLDRRPKQVFVEAMIVEVSVNKALDLGTKFRLSAEQNGNPILIGGVGTVDTSTIQTVLSGLAGFSIGGVGNILTVPVTTSDGTQVNLSAPGFAALFSLSDFKNIVNVLSTPHILTSDNSEAEIMVGQNVPFLSKLEREATTTDQPLLQSIERKDVGIRLKIKPKISEGDFVKLDIYQEISAISTTTVTGAADLITTKRSAKTNVVIKNSQTVVIGGLIQDQNNDSVSKMPVLGDLPLIGWLFKFKNETDAKTNLLVFITPYIIEDFRGLQDLRDRKETEFKEKSPLLREPGNKKSREKTP